MRQGTTPTHVFTTNIDLTKAVAIYITYEQGGEVVVEKELPDIHVEEDKIKTTLTQEETFAFSTTADVKIQIRAKFDDDTAVACQIIRTCVGEVLKEGVI